MISDYPFSSLLIEDKDWQVFELDTSWNLSSLGSAVLKSPQVRDYGRNGVLTKAQVVATQGIP